MTVHELETFVLEQYWGGDACHQTGDLGACAETGAYEPCHLLVGYSAIAACLAP